MVGELASEYQPVKIALPTKRKEVGRVIREGHKSWKARAVTRFEKREQIPKHRRYRRSIDQSSRF
jgi:hypothetical protein